VLEAARRHRADVVRALAARGDPVEGCTRPVVSVLLDELRLGAHGDWQNTFAVRNTMFALADAGADMDARDDDGNTALFFEVFADLPLADLFRLRVNPLLRNHAGKTPLDALGARLDLKRFTDCFAAGTTILRAYRRHAWRRNVLMNPATRVGAFFVRVLARVWERRDLRWLRQRARKRKRDEEDAAEERDGESGWGSPVASPSS
jgi:hypothetical protein